MLVLLSLTVTSKLIFPKFFGFRSKFNFDIPLSIEFFIIFVNFSPQLLSRRSNVSLLLKFWLFSRCLSKVFVLFSLEFFELRLVSFEFLTVFFEKFVTTLLTVSLLILF